MGEEVGVRASHPDFLLQLVYLCLCEKFTRVVREMTEQLKKMVQACSN